jgi:hypothetical protein
MEMQKTSSRFQIKVCGFGFTENFAKHDVSIKLADSLWKAKNNKSLNQMWLLEPVVLPADRY